MKVRTASILSAFSLADIKKLLAMKEKIDGLETRRTALTNELAAVEFDLQKLVDAALAIEGGAGSKRAGRATGRTTKRTASRSSRPAGKTAKKKAKKATRKAAKNTATKKAKKKTKKTVKKTVKKAAKKRAKKTLKRAARRTGKAASSKRKTGRKATGSKRTSKKRAGRPVVGKVGRRGQPRLEDVVAELVARNGGPMPYQAILQSIVDGKLYASRSKNFDNVLRRTLSTSERLERVGRGVYGLA